MLSLLSPKKAITFSPRRARIVQQKSLSFCGKHILSELIKKNDGDILVVSARLVSRSFESLRRVGVASNWDGYAEMSASIRTVVFPSERRQKRAPAWVLRSPFLYRGSQSNLQTRISQRISLPLARIYPGAVVTMPGRSIR